METEILIYYVMNFSDRDQTEANYYLGPVVKPSNCLVITILKHVSDYMISIEMG